MTSPIKPTPRWRFRIIVLALSTAAAVAASLWVMSRTVPGTHQSGTTGQALIGGPFSLTDHHGRAVTDNDFRGRLMLVYFGYGFCPDVCPMELAVMSRALDLLKAKADYVQPLFITIDPARDTVTALADYMSNFHPGFLGLTGTKDQISAVARAYRVYYAKAPAEGDRESGDYLMDHSSMVYLMDEEGRYLAHFSAATGAADMAAEISSHIPWWLWRALAG